MKVSLESTARLVTLEIDGAIVPARIWEGRTAGGVKCFAFITLIAAASGDDLAEFDRELLEQRQPSPAIQAIPDSLALRARNWP